MGRPASTRTPLEDLGLLVLRLVGLGLAYHGWPKVVWLTSGAGGPLIDGVASLGFPAPLVFAWAAALAEFAGGLLVAVGLFTRLAACAAGFTMAVAAFAAHHAFQRLLVAVGLLSVPPETLAKWGDPELALLFLAAFVALAALGAGRFSLDHLRSGRR